MKVLSPSPGLLRVLSVGLQEHWPVDYGVIELVELVVLMGCGCMFEQTCLDGLTPYCLSGWRIRKKSGWQMKSPK